MQRRVHGAIALALAGILAACQSNQPNRTGVDARPKTKASASPTAVVPPIGPGDGLIGTGVIPPDGAGVISRDGAGVISRDGAGVISRDGAGVISRDGAGITGVARLPAGVISRDGAGVISRDGAGVISRDGAGVISRDGAGYRVAALDQSVPIRKQRVYLLDATGRLVLGADNEPMTTETDDQGRFAFNGFVNQRNLIVAIQLYDDKGLVTSVLPRGDAAGRTLDLDLASTLTATYIQEQFVKPQADPTAIFEKLPAELEAATRRSVADAATSAPEDLKPASVIAAVDGLRFQAKAVDDQFVEVKRVLLAGLSNQGIGLPADYLESDALSVALGPNRELVFAGRLSLRVWRKDAAGKLQPVAGNGLLPPADVPVAGPAPGDGGPAIATPINPGALTYAKDGALLIADSGSKRIRRVAPDGTISTVAAHADWAELRGVYEEPDGALVVAAHASLYRVPKGGQPVHIAGKVRVYEQSTAFLTPPSGDGGKPLDAVFRGLTSVARDPLTGDVVVFDSGQIRRVSAQAVTALAGAKAGGYSEGSAATAQFGAGGGLAIRPDGTILLADVANQRVRQVANGTVSTFIGNGTGILSGDGGPALSAGLAGPSGLALSPEGDVYIVDSGYVRALIDGTMHTLIGGTRGFDTPRKPTDVQLFGPAYLTYDAVQNVMWVGDARHLWRWDLAADTLVSAFGGGIGGASFVEGQTAASTALYQPTGYTPLGAGKWATIAADPATQYGRGVVVEDGKMKTILGGATAIDISGKPTPAVGAFLIANSADLVALDGWFYYSFPYLGTVFRFQLGGSTELFAGGGAATGDGHLARELKFGQVTRLAKGPDGMLYVGTPDAIYRIDPATSQATSLAAATKLVAPSGFAWDAAGHLYFSEPEAGRVRRLRSDTGAVELVAGAGAPALNGGTIDAGLGAPVGLAFDGKGDLYIADVRYGQIKIVRKP